MASLSIPWTIQLSVVSMTMPWMQVHVTGIYINAASTDGGLMRNQIAACSVHLRHVLLSHFTTHAEYSAQIRSIANLFGISEFGMTKALQLTKTDEMSPTVENPAIWLAIFGQVL